MDLTSKLEIYASHIDFLQEVAQRLDASWWLHHNLVIHCWTVVSPIPLNTHRIVKVIFKDTGASMWQPRMLMTIDTATMDTQSPWLPVVLDSSCHRYQSQWIPVVMHSIYHGYESLWILVSTLDKLLTMETSRHGWFQSLCYQLP